MSAAGDVNGDGFDDLLIGAYKADPNGNAASGASYVVFGKANFSATAGNLNLSTLNGTNGFKLSGVAAYDDSGRSVSAAGDVNGDGFDDLLIGADRADANGNSNSGASYLVFGKADFSATAGNLNLSTLNGTGGFKLSGVAEYDFSGRAVSAAGDVNGDGFDDLLIGAPAADANNLSDSGASYVFFGFDTGGGSAQSLTGNASANVLIGGTGGDTLIGNGGADVLRGGEGNDVLAISDLTFQRLDGGRGHDTLRLDGAGFALDLTARADNRLTGFEEIDLSGVGNHTLTLNPHEVLALSDLSNTLIVQADAGDTVTIGSGWVPGSDEVIGATTFHVFTSGAATLKIAAAVVLDTSLQLSSLDGTNGFKLSGVAARDDSGRSVSDAGDVNGDGFDDLLIGAYGADPNGNLSGASYVVFGKTDVSATANLNLSTLNGFNGFKLSGVAADDRSGRSVSAAGDVNGDGFDDLLIGAYQADPNGLSSGTSYVIFGRADFSATAGNFNLSTLDGTNGFALNGVGANDYSGVSVSAAGDVNGDGFDDLLIGAYRADPNGDYSGASYVVFGKADFSATANINLSTLNGTNGFKLSGVAADDRSGFSVSDAGDVNGDGFDDVIISAPGAGPNGNATSGASYVVFGFDTGAVTHPGTSAGETLTGNASANVIIGGRGGDTLLGGGGADVLRGGEGADVLAVTDLTFKRIAGGNGTDTLRLDGAGLALDLTTLPDNRLTGIERLDIRGSGNNPLTLDVQEVLNLSGESNTLLIRNDATDPVAIGSGWSFAGSQTIESVSYTVFTQGAATLKIENPAPFIAIGDAAILEGNAGTTSLNFTVTRGGAPLTATATVDFVTANGTAIAGEDYAAKMGTVTFNPGITAQTITIDVTGETRAELSETLFINLSNASGATLFDSQALGTITNDDSTLTVSTDRLTATFRDVDGDLVTIKAGKPVLDRIDFTLLPTGDAIGGEQLQKLNLRDIGAANAGVTLTITAKPGLLGGDSFVNLGAIDATGVNLGAVSIAGDLGQIDAGAGTAVPPALASLTVGSLGRLGLATQGAVGASLSSDIAGALGKLVVKTDLIGAKVSVTGGAAGLIGGVAIGRSIVGGATSLAGSITASGAIGPVTLGGSLLGGAGADSASIHGAKVTSVTLGGSMLGGAGSGSAVVKGDTSIGAVTVKHDVRGGASGSGAISSGGTLGAVAIAGDLVGGAGDLSGSIFATGAITSVTLGGNLDATGVGRTGLFAGATLGPVKIGGSVLSSLITSGGDGKGLTIGGSVRDSQVLAGFATSGTPLTSDAQLGALAVKGDWIASSAAAGINPGTGGFGTADDVVIPGTDAAKFSRIASIAIGGEARGTDGGSDSFAFTAEQIGSLKIGKTVFPLTISATAEDELFTGPTFDLRARELDATAPAAPAPLPVIGVSTLAFSLDFKTATFRDVDGDLVTVKNDKGMFDMNNFTLPAGPNGGAIFQKLNLAGDPDFDGKNASITITAVRGPGGGDGWVDVGAIDATGIDLVKVTVGGDLGVIDAGNGDSATPALTSLTVHSLGSRGLNTQATLGASAHSDIIGRVGALTVATDIVGAAFAVNGGATDSRGSIGTAKVGGSIIGGGTGLVAELTATGDITSATVTGDIRGGSVLHSGRIRAGGKIGTLLVSGSLVGGGGEGTGAIEGAAGLGAVTVGRSLLGGGGQESGSLVARSGNITSVKVGGDLLGGAGDRSGSIFATGAGDLGAIGAATVRGSVFATTGAKSGILSDATLGAVTIAGDVRALGAARVKISAEGIATPVDAIKALAIKSLTIGGSVALADLLAGYDITGTLTNADVQTGPVAVKGDWTASNLLAGVSFAGAIFSGGEQPAIAARIASIVIGGSVLGTTSTGDSFAFSAQQIGSMKVGLALLPITTAINDLPLGATGDVRVREVA